MAVKEFQDKEGRTWRVWEIRPEAIHPVTRAEDYLSDCFTVGWLVFETLTGDDKRRLCPYPKAWPRATERQLEALLADAEKVPLSKMIAARQAIGASDRAVPEPAEDEKPDITDLKVIRSFRYPGGRLWTVCVIDRPEDGGPPALRFAAGSRYLDLRPWPKDWVDAPNERLVEMIRAIAPRPATAPPAGVRARRFNDTQPEQPPR